MTHRANLTWERSLDKRWRAPIYLLVLGKVREQDGSETIPEVRYSTGVVYDKAGDTDPIMSNLKGASAKVTPLEGKSSIGSISFDLLEDDTDRQITKLIFRYPMLNRKATLYMGFADIAEEDYVPMFTGRIYSYAIQKDNLTWRFEVYDLHSKAKALICAGRTWLTRGCGPGSDLVVNSTAGFTLGDGYVGSATEGKYYVKIDKEIVAYNRVNATNFYECTRGAFGTIPVAHQARSLVTQFVVVRANAIDLALQILMSTGEAQGTTPGSNGDFDVLPAGMGLGLTSSDVDVARFLDARNRWGATAQLQFEMDEQVEAKAFIEKEIYRVINAYPAITGAGKISCKVYTPPFPSVDQPVLDDTRLIGAPNWQGDASVEYFINQVVIKYNWDFRSRQFLSWLVFADSTSQVKYGKVATYTLEAKGLRAAISPLQNIRAIAQRILKRFGNPPPVLKAKAFLPLITAETGDVALFSSAKVPDLQRGVSGVSNALMEVTELRPDYERGTVELMLANTQFSYGRKYAAISPSSAAPTNFPVYGSATAAQRKYAFISNGINDTFGVMSNGDDGYYIAP